MLACFAAPLVETFHLFAWCSSWCSKGRNGHIPYRDSKLTRILQPSLGGNARTAIICTMSPARSHIEQSRNTLLFATCAKEVVTSAQVNVVMSDKALVKHLQKELARLESELRGPGPISSTTHSDAHMRKKDAQIQKVTKYILNLQLWRICTFTHTFAYLFTSLDTQRKRTLSLNRNACLWMQICKHLNSTCSQWNTVILIEFWPSK